MKKLRLKELKKLAQDNTISPFQVVNSNLLLHISKSMFFPLQCSDYTIPAYVPDGFQQISIMATDKRPLGSC